MVQRLFIYADDVAAVSECMDKQKTFFVKQYRKVVNGMTRFHIGHLENQ